MAQVIECLPSKCKALSLNPSAIKKKKTKKYILRPCAVLTPVIADTP
jgi:hypothetical protein